jgi:surface protein
LATPSAEYVFKDWSGSLSGSTNPSPVTMDIDKSVVGNFEKRQYPLSLTIEGQGTVKEEIAVVAPQSQYPSGTTVKLTAQPGTNYEFKEWSGDLSSTVNPFSIVVNKSINLKVTFVYSDKDGDGVFDIKDKCPSTIKGETVDSTGCSKSQIDTDKDGIFDNKDKCPSTIKGEAVDSTGCSKSQIDSDKDGIFDNKDKCPNTPKGEVVDSNGCSKSQIDTDGDGIPDSKDMDNNTRKGVPVDANGVMLNPIYLDKNGVTIKAYDWAIVGDNGIVNNIEYKVINLAQLRDMILKGEDYSKVVTTKVVDFSGLFGGINEIKFSITSWDVSNVTSFLSTFQQKIIGSNSSLKYWDTKSVRDMRYCFSETPINPDISNWNVSSVTSMDRMFYKNLIFNQPIGNWDVSRVVSMNGIFSNSNFNQSIENWNVSSLNVMSEMFYGNYKFNQPLGKWNVSNVGNMAFLFTNSIFNQPIGSWDVGKVANMAQMFVNSEFNQSIGNWNVSNVATMQAMFNRAKKFNQPIGNWDVSKVRDMAFMFNENVFNQDLSKWNVTLVSSCNGFAGGSFTLPRPNFINCTP